jgi:aminopeptidase N
VTHTLTGLDTLRLESESEYFEFVLNEKLTPRIQGGELVEIDEEEPGIKGWRFDSRTGPGDLWIIEFAGELFQSTADATFSRENIGREIDATIGDEGVYLSGGAAWYPWLAGNLKPHRVTTILPEGWLSLTQGRRILKETVEGWTRTVWDTPFPSEGINLVANRFHYDFRVHGETTVETYFFPEDSSLAAGYLDDCVGYLDLYESFLPPYPYAKFAVVENFFPTGYGMPSWTLLGQQVLRLPFIRMSSLGHELAHNWWGNSVFVGEGGNWCEGITVYTADYLYKEMKAPELARQYRKNNLKDYTLFTRDGGDFPLTEFVSRHNSATRSVGYGKSMMIFHMLEEIVGRDNFRSALRRVVEEKQWSAAVWGDFFRAVEIEGGLAAGALKDEQRQWIEEAGAASLEMGEVETTRQGDSWRVRGELLQIGEPLILRVPVRLTTSGEPITQIVKTDENSYKFEFTTTDKPLAIDIDPDFHVFRRLYDEEMEATISLTLAGETPLFVLEKGLDDELEQAFRDFATSWVEGEPEFVEDGSVAGEQATVIWLGTKPPSFRDAPAGLQVTPFFTVFQEKRLEPAGNAIVYTGKRGEDRGFMGVLASAPAEVYPLGRKVPHYGKYSYLAFEKGRNCLKGNWDLGAGPLHRDLD